MSTSCSPLDGRHIWTERGVGLDWWLLNHLAGLCRVVARWCDRQTEHPMLREARETKARLYKMAVSDKDMFL